MEEEKEPQISEETSDVSFSDKAFEDSLDFEANIEDLPL
jgi:hypothetical protein